MEKRIKKINNLLVEYQPQIDELRKILFRTVITFVVAGGISLVFNRKIILLLISLFDLKNVNIVLTSPYQFINLAVGVSIIIGLISAAPVLGYYLLKYVEPALKVSEFKLIKKLVPISVILFIFGSSVGVKIEQFVVSLYSQTTTDYALSNFWDVEAFLTQVLVMAFTMGLVFELPIVLTILIRTNIISVNVLAKQRRYVYAGLTLFGILLPPTDTVSLLMIILPLFVLFECTLLLNRAN